MNVEVLCVQQDPAYFNLGIFEDARTWRRPSNEGFVSRCMGALLSPAASAAIAIGSSMVATVYSNSAERAVKGDQGSSDYLWIFKNPEIFVVYSNFRIIISVLISHEAQ